MDTLDCVVVLIQVIQMMVPAASMVTQHFYLGMMHLKNALRYNKTYKHVTLPYWDWTQLFVELPLLVRNLTINDPTNSSLVLP